MTSEKKTEHHICPYPSEPLVKVEEKLVPGESKEKVPEEVFPLHAVIYTDGGCRPSKGRGGFGYHGYLHNSRMPKQGSGAKETPTQVGYLVGSKEKAVEIVSYVDFWTSVEGTTTNNAMELLAVCEALEYVDKKDVISVVIFTDSQTVEAGLNEHISGWIAKDWKKSNNEDVANREFWERLLKIRGILEQKEVKVTIEKVRGHNGDFGNTLADTLATRGVYMASKDRHDRQLIETPGKGYWNCKSLVNRMFSKSSWYFNTNSPESFRSNDRYVYHLGKHGDNDNLLGKAMSDVSFSVIYLKTPDPVLEIIREYQDEVSDGQSNRVIIGKLDVINNPKNYHDVLTYGTSHLDRPGEKLDILNAEKVTVTKEKRPAYLAYRAIGALTQLESILEDYVYDNKGPQAMLLTATDISDEFFDKETNKKDKVICTLKKNITVSTRSLDVKVNYDTGKHTGELPIRLLYDMDLPSRNALSAYASSQPKVTVVTWRESDVAFRVATIVEVDGDVGIWSSIHSNLKVLGPDS